MKRFSFTPHVNTVASWWLNSLQEWLSTFVSANFVLSQVNTTTLRVAAGAANDQVGIGITGTWRWNTANADAVHPGGGAGTYDVYVTGSADSIAGSVDSTVYTFGLAIRAAASPPPTAIYRKVGTCVWNGAAITSISQSVGAPSSHDYAPDIAAAVAAEAALRVSGDATNASAISTNAAAISANASAISSEASTRASADTTNATAISSEATTRATGDSTNATAITAEASARSSADSSEASTRLSADNALDSRVDSLEATRAADYLIAAGSVPVTLDGSSDGRINFAVPFPTGIISIAACVGDDNNGDGVIIAIKNRDLSGFDFTGYQLGPGNIPGSLVVVDYVAAGF